VNNELETTTPTRRVWPWLVLAAFLMFVALAIFWVSREVRRVRSIDRFDFRPPDKAAVDPLAGFREALTGGDAPAGRKIFFEKPEASCARCHRVDGQGGENGPGLDGLGSRQSRGFILESMVAPNAHITEGYESVGVVLKSGTGLAGVLRGEDATNLVIHTPDEGPVNVPKSEVTRRVAGLSPMPADFATLISKDELRDLVAFLASLTTNAPAAR